MVRRIISEEGTAALYRGCWMSCVGGGVYAGLKFMTYDATKARSHILMHSRLRDHAHVSTHHARDFVCR